MRQGSSLKLIVIAVALFGAVILAPNIGSPLRAATQAQGAPAVPTADELDQLLAPVALYPDSLLAQITTASTNPQEILDVDNWLQANPDLTGTPLTDAAQAQGFDPAFIALASFPQIISMMAENIDDYAAIGQAFTADQTSVSASIQRLRAEAYASGALRSNEQMQVEVQQAADKTVYVIQPASPQIVYVPQYDPTVVYAGPGPGVVAAPIITFGAGIAIGALLVDNRPWGWGGWGWNWGLYRPYYNRAVWVGWGNPYRPPNYWYRPRPIRWTSRPGYRGDWRYRPPNYRPPSYPGTRPPSHRPWGPNNRPSGYRPQPRPGGNNPNSPGRPGNPGTRPGGSNPNQPNPSRPNPREPRPGTPTTPRPQPKPGTPTTPREPRPGTPTTPRPQPKPGTPSTGRPSTHKPSTNRPTTPRAQPETKPATQKPQAQPKPANQKPQSQSRPAQQSKPAPKSQPNTRSQPN